MACAKIHSLNISNGDSRFKYSKTSKGNSLGTGKIDDFIEIYDYAVPIMLGPRKLIFKLLIH